MLKASLRFLASWAVGVRLTEAEGAGVDVGVSESVALTPERLALVALALVTAPRQAKPAQPGRLYHHKTPQSTSRH